VQFDYRATGFNVIDNGHTVQVNVGTGNSIQVGGRRYELVQFHFHRPSEERINGRQYDMSLHLVHKDPRAGWPWWRAARARRGAAGGAVGVEQPAAGKGRGAARLRRDRPEPAAAADRGYYTYMGSLTTPPCSEGVLWMVMRQPVPVSQARSTSSRACTR
jgi:carbonic anhydrase